MSWYQDSQPVEGPRTKDGAPVKATVPEKEEGPEQISDDKIITPTPQPILQDGPTELEEGPTMKINKKGETVEVNGKKVEPKKADK